MLDLAHMYLAVDIGGTKTLVASFSAEGELLQTDKFPTPKDYEEFILNLAETVTKMTTENVIAMGVAVPGLLNREKGIVYALGNLPWSNKPIRDDISSKLGNIPVIIENDAKLAGLSEAILLQDTYRDVLFATVSTGIGAAFIQEGKLVRALQDMEMGKMPLMHEGVLEHWEDFAGGRGVVEHFKKRASEITDPKDWELIGTNIAYGLAAGCSILQPEAIVLGGGVGQFADKFSGVILEYFDQHLHSVVRKPKAILAAQRAGEAGVYGCYEIVNQFYGESA